MMLVQMFMPAYIMAEELEPAPEASSAQVTSSPSPSPAESASTTTESSPPPSASPDSSATEVNNTTTAEATIESGTAESSSPSPYDTQMETGNATSESNNITAANTTMTDSSSIDLSVVNITDPNTGSIAPFPMDGSSGTAQSPAPTPDSLLELEVDNEATIAAETAAGANTGTNNQVNTELLQDIGMNTGNATATANGVALANTTLVDSTVQVGVVNVMAPYEGDIIIDPLELNGDGSGAFAPGVAQLTIDNNGNIVTNANAAAVTGDNSQLALGNEEMTTGEATALSASTTVAGATIVDADVMQIMAENLWLWNGSIYGLEGPGSVTDPQSLLAGGSATVCTGGCTNISVGINNNVDITNNVTAAANTGGNSQLSYGDATMNTGNAMASATATTIANTTLINSRLTILYLMLFRQWNGNLIFAYPDLATVVSAPHSVPEGADIPFTVTVRNTGLAKARGVNYSYNITNDSHDVGSGGESWGDVAPGAIKTKTVSFNTAGRGGHVVRLTANALGTNREMSDTNNTGQAYVEVLVTEAPAEDTEEKEPEPKGESNDANASREVPQLALTSSNNVGDFVYAGDGVAYEIVVNNNGPIDAEDVILVHELYTQDGDKLTTMVAPIGDIALNKKKTVRFVMTTSPALNGGNYYTRATALGESESGAKTKSNSADNNLTIRERIAGIIVGSALAQEPVAPDQTSASVDDRLVLGAVTSAPVCTDCQAQPWYIALLAGTAVYYAHGWRKRNFASLARMGMFLPLTAYGGLLYTAGNCRQGLMIVSQNDLCRLFLILSLGGYLTFAGMIWAARRIAQKLNPANWYAWR